MNSRGDGRCGRRGALLEPMVLAVLQRQSTHGYELRRAVLDMTRESVQVDVGGLYRTLRKLEDDGFVKSSWTEGESGPQRRCYSITAEGLELAADWAEHLSERSRLLALISSALTSDEVTQS